MKQADSHIIRNGAIASFLGGIALYFLPSLWNIVKNILKFIIGMFEKLWSYLTTEHLIYGWVLIVIIGMSIPTIILVYFWLKPSRQPNYTDLYQTDTLHGVKWRWGYINGKISFLHSFCLNCNIELVFSEIIPKIWDDTVSTKTQLICERCQKVRATIDGTKPYAYSMIEREIRRKIRNNEWMQKELTG